MRLIAHRGFAGLYPENTLRAVQEAVAFADAIEVDVRRSGSDEAVVIHDATVDRVSDGTGRVADLSRHDLGELDVLGTGEGVPTLAELFDAVPAAVGVNVELKEPALADNVDEIASRHANHVIVSSFLDDALEACQAVDPSVPRALIVGENTNPRDAILRATKLDCDYLHPHLALCDERLVNESHRAGMSVNAWTVDSQSEANALEAVGVDGVIADRWGVLPSRP